MRHALRFFTSSGRIRGVLLERNVVKVSGKDAFNFLMGLTTNDLRNLHNGQLTLFLSAAGRILYESFLFNASKDNSQFLLDCDKRGSKELLAHLHKYVLRSSVSISLEEHSVYQVWDKLPVSEGVYSVKDPRSPRIGYRVFFKGKLQNEFNINLLPLKTYTIERMLHGVPEGIDSIIPNKSFPMQSNMDLYSALSTTKGCYTGQELTAITRNKGVTRRRILPVQFYTLREEMTDVQTLNEEFNSEIPPGTELLSPSNKKAGVLLERAHNLGLALVSLESLNSKETLHLPEGIKARVFPGALQINA